MQLKEEELSKMKYTNDADNNRSYAGFIKRLGIL